jgi:foldase protein PrsA
MQVFGVRSLIPAVLIGLLALQGCQSDSSSPGPAAQAAPPPPAPANAISESDIVATVRGDVITRRDLEPVLMEGYGLDVLLRLVQLDLVEQEATNLHISVTPDDVARERSLTIADLKQATQELAGNGQPTTQPDTDFTPEQENQLLDQLLQEQHVSRPEFDLIMRTNAYLRKIAEPLVESKLTEDAIRKQFDMMYGEKVLVRCIICNDMNEIGQVRRDLAAGKSFEDVARLRSVDPQMALIGGELPPFTFQDTNYPPEIRQVAFDLKKGEVSDAVQLGQHIYILKLIDRIPPAFAKFEDYHDAVKHELVEANIKQVMKTLRDRLAQMAMESLHIREPVLAQQWTDKIERKNGEIHDANQIRQELDKQHSQGPISPAPGSDLTAPAPAQPPATLPATAP